MVLESTRILTCSLRSQKVFRRRTDQIPRFRSALRVSRSLRGLKRQLTVRYTVPDPYYASRVAPSTLIVSRLPPPGAPSRPRPSAASANRPARATLYNKKMPASYDDPPSTSYSPASTSARTPGKAIKRTKSGCTVCRRRKVKCDERPGTCAACERINAVCEWDEPWSAEKAAAEKGAAAAARKRPRPKKACAQVIHSLSEL